MDKVYVLLVDGQVDQICYSKEELQREKRDLRNMGFDKVTSKAFNTYMEAEEFVDMRNRY